MCVSDLYVLPTIEFVGGETQDLAFNVFLYNGDQPFSLSGCTSNFSVVSFMNKNGTPLIDKEMTVIQNNNLTSDNVLTVTLDPTDTVDLCGKYIYQIEIMSAGGDTEIPKQGLMYIANNINKAFVRG